MSSVQSSDQRDALAVRGKSLNKSYGSRVILKNLHINVPKGAIYALMGSSGCGKTTLLKCILGLCNTENGDLEVLGIKPCNGIPGIKVGYMPQETALFGRMTIKELLSYFGVILGLTTDRIQERTNSLICILDLPPHDSLIGPLSGGEKRRVSLAVALLHEPELLVLDEPIVGLDRDLRDSIWKHLKTVVESQDGKKVTVIMTTHYEEDAKHANEVYKMREGKLEKIKVVEDCPEVGPEVGPEPQKEISYLEQQDDQSSDGSKSSCRKRKSVDRPSDEKKYLPKNKTGVEHKYESCRRPFFCPSVRNIKAQAIKNLTLMWRNKPIQIQSLHGNIFLAFEFFLPAFQIILFCVCIGKDPHSLQVAVVNHDQEQIGQNYGKDFLSSLDTKTINQVVYDNLDQAKQSVRNLETWGVIAIGRTFSKDLMLRFKKGVKVKNSTIDGSLIHLYLDMTNQQIQIVLQTKMRLAFQDFSRNALISARMNGRLADLPIKLKEQIYGVPNPNFTNFIAPGIILSIIFFMATGLTTLSFVMEKIEGLYERSLVAGMTPFEILLGHICTQLLVMVVHVIILFIIVFSYFQVPSEGPLPWVVLLTLLQGFCGMTLGLLISTACEQVTSAVRTSLGSVYPMILMSGIIWPIESMPEWMRYISVCMPITYAAEAMRNVLSRGLSIAVTEVWRGYLVTICWIVGLLLSTVLVLKLKK